MKVLVKTDIFSNIKVDFILSTRDVSYRVSVKEIDLAILK